jgi:exodeoxyribonuclease VII large subunit
VTKEKKIYTLTQLNQSIERYITNSFGSLKFWVVAEVTKINRKNGNTYLELVDSEQGVTTAIMSANIWASTYKYITEKLGHDLPNVLKVGNKVLFQLRIDFNKIYGLKVIILDIDAAYSYGEMERKKLETIKKLQHWGLYAKQRKLHLPIVAKRIALIGSKNTSGYRDFLNELYRNKVYTNFKVKEFNASVQGDKAVGDIIEALREARTYDVDAIVIVRGGGSKMDLNAFNDYELAKEICKTKIPVLTGIGHESDEVVADLVCKLNCITPTAVAKHLYVQIGMFSSNVQTSFDRVLTIALSIVAGHKDEFTNITKYLVHYSQQMVSAGNQELGNNAHRLQYGFFEVLNKERSRLDNSFSKATTASLNLLELTRDIELPSLQDKLKMMTINLLQQSNIKLSNIEDTLKYLDPEKLLKTGYTISTVDGVDALKTKGTIVGKEMVTISSNKKITSTITKAEEQ